MTLADWVQILTTAFAAIAAIVAAVSTAITLRSTRAAELSLKQSHSLTLLEFVRLVEHDYRAQYSQIFKELEPKTSRFRPELRKVVHDMLSTLMIVYVGRKVNLLDPEMDEYLFNTYLDWLRAPDARQVWEEEFRGQTGAFPPGFIAFIDEQLTVPAGSDGE